MKNDRKEAFTKQLQEGFQIWYYSNPRYNDLLFKLERNTEKNVAIQNKTFIIRDSKEFIRISSNYFNKKKKYNVDKRCYLAGSLIMSFLLSLIMLPLIVATSELIVQKRDIIDKVDTEFVSYVLGLSILVVIYLLTFVAFYGDYKNEKNNLLHSLECWTIKELILLRNVVDIEILPRKSKNDNEKVSATNVVTDGIGRIKP